MRLKSFHIIIFLCIIMIGCSVSKNMDIDTDNLNLEDREVSSIQTIPKKTDYSLFLNIPRALDLYEPKEGCYAGAYILSNSNINFDMKKFEEMTGISHGIYIRNMKLGTTFPIDWVLECTSQMKTPNIILQPPTRDLPYQELLLEEAAKEFGRYFIPMFVQFYPNPQQYGSPEEYKEFFIKARNLFKDYAPNVAFIWSINAENGKDCLLYYPGDEMVDWIGINVYDLIYVNDIKNNKNIFEDLDFIYYLFQGKKPMMISQLGISHYSNKDHGYYIDEAADKITSFYNSIKNSYPQIKGIHYMDFNNIDIAPDGIGYDNFKITSQSKLTESYKKALSNPYFIDTVDIQSMYSIGKQWIVSYYPIYKQNDHLYISENVLKYEWCNYDLSINEKDIILIEDHIYYSLENLEAENNLNISIDPKSKQIKIQ